MKPINLVEKTLFDEVRSPRVPLAEFDLSHNLAMTGDMGILYPVLCQECVPGDVWKHDTQVVVRFQPLVAPVLHEINVFVHYFFVPYRILDENFSKWIMGPKPGDTEPPAPPRWSPSSPAKMAVGTLWDYLGFPAGLSAPPAGALPLDYPRRAYNMIYNEYYRDINLQNEVPLHNEDLLRRNWEKDYFTAALPWQQRGTPPAMPLTGLAPLTYPNSIVSVGGPGNSFWVHPGVGSNQFRVGLTQDQSNVIGALNQGNANLNLASGQFTLPDLRTLIVIQQWMERNALAGTRYNEYLMAHFGLAPNDQTLQRPEYLGGYKAPVLVTDIPQTSQTATTPQGTLAGKGTSVDIQPSYAFRVEEYGLILGLLSVMPKPYYSQGISRQWLRETRYEFYNPLFALLSEQPIKVAEIYASTSAADNTDIFGYQGRYDELRYIPSRFAGQMRTTFDYWHLGRKFASRPYLNSSFLQCNPDKRIFAVQNEPGLVISVGHRISAKRPLPRLALPGLQTV